MIPGRCLSKELEASDATIERLAKEIEELKIEISKLRKNLRWALDTIENYRKLTEPWRNQ